MNIPEIPVGAVDPIPWQKAPLPRGISQAPLNQWRIAHSKFSEMVQEVSTPCFYNGQIEQRSILKPNSGFEARNLPGGIFHLSDEFPKQARILDDEISQISQGELVLWCLGFENVGAFLCDYNANVREWVKSDLILSPIIFSAISVDFAIFVDEQMRYTSIFSDARNIEKVDKCFNGKDSLKKIFTIYVDDGGVGFGDSDARWARENLLEF